MGRNRAAVGAALGRPRPEAETQPAVPPRGRERPERNRLARQHRQLSHAGRHPNRGRGIKTRSKCSLRSNSGHIPQLTGGSSRRRGPSCRDSTPGEHPRLRQGAALAHGGGPREPAGQGACLAALHLRDIRAADRPAEAVSSGQTQHASWEERSLQTEAGHRKQMHDQAPARCLARPPPQQQIRVPAERECLPESGRAGCQSSGTGARQRSGPDIRRRSHR